MLKLQERSCVGIDAVWQIVSEVGLFRGMLVSSAVSMAVLGVQYTTWLLWTVFFAQHLAQDLTEERNKPPMSDGSSLVWCSLHECAVVPHILCGGCVVCRCDVHSCRVVVMSGVESKVREDCEEWRWGAYNIGGQDMQSIGVDMMTMDDLSGLRCMMVWAGDCWSVWHHAHVDNVVSASGYLVTGVQHP